MHDLNIVDFYKDTAIALASLYKRFPIKSALYIEDICGPDEPDDFGLHSPRYNACFSAMIWLAEEHYLRFSDTIQQEALDECVLSQEAFLLLSSALPEENTTRAIKLAELLKHGNSEKLNTFMIDLMSVFSFKK